MSAVDGRREPPRIEERKNTDGSISYRVRVRLPDLSKPVVLGKPAPTKQVPKVFDTWADAEHFRQLIRSIGLQRAVELVDAKTPAAEPVSRVTVASWLTHHVEHLTGVTEGTRRDYLQMIAISIGPALGNIPLAVLSRDDVTGWVNEMERRGLSGKTIKNRHAFLSSGLTRAVGVHLPTNVAKGIRLPRQDAKTREPVFLTPDEYRALELAMHPIGRPLLLLMAGTGMRIGEATALQVGDVDLTGRDPVVRVVRAWKHTDNNTQELGPPKSRKGKRSIALSDAVADYLADLTAGRGPKEWVVTTSRGDAWRANYWREKYWHDAVKRSGIGKSPTPHDIRHSHASWLIAQGVVLPVIQARLGHEKITTTVDTYGHLSSDMHRTAAYAIGRALGGGRMRELPAGS
ncbi:tyrosine-type recombinase/integrase [Kineococcus radiotolerans]|uniref:Phage integrase family protein n=1 Tax=Kineococcus radiotolerans (strain ATCC BAA-149 / DSM 14245 / SRS30216) TaxID=266940 RepID=A6W8N8_KINRD|nr:site-specific integrase [Kineococcus radiotolerans]ABS03177.1 phage integrase family protein [Kineococcus radiotolerans SRS30216 = ATCC BAA-149]